MNLSLITPCYNAEDFITTFTDCLRGLEVPTDFQLEIIIVDNGSGDSSIEKLKLFKKTFCNYPVKILRYTEKQSSYASRNFGVKYSQGDFLLFTDIDCVLAHDFIIKVKEHIDNGYGDQSIIAGHVQLFLSQDPNVYELYDYMIGFNMESYVKEKTGVTAITIIQRELFLEAGGFDEVESGGDRMFFKKLVEDFDLQFQYHPKIEVNHPCRKSYQMLWNKAKRVGRGLVQYEMSQSKKHQTMFLIKNLIGSLLQVHQLKVLITQKRFVTTLPLLKQFQLIALTFWVGFLSRIYIVGRLLQSRLDG